MAERRRSRPIASCVVDRGRIQICPRRTGRSGKGNFRDSPLVEKKEEKCLGNSESTQSTRNCKNSRKHLHAHSTYLRRLLHLSRLLWALLTIISGSGLYLRLVSSYTTPSLLLCSLHFQPVLLLRCLFRGWRYSSLKNHQNALLG